MSSLILGDVYWTLACYMGITLVEWGLKTISDEKKRSFFSTIVFKIDMKNFKRSKQYFASGVSLVTLKLTLYQFLQLLRVNS